MKAEKGSGILVDTDVAIDYLRGKEYARGFMEGLWEQDMAHLSILSVYELLAGMRPKEEEATMAFIEACHIQGLEIPTAEKGGKIFRTYRQKGFTLTSIDCLIMATAVLKNLKIATRNVRHYPEERILLRVKK